MHRIAGLLDGFELWVVGLPFIPQFIVVLIGMVPISLAIASVLDWALRAALRAIGRDHGTPDVAAIVDQADTGREPVAPAVEMRGPVQRGAC